MADKIEELIESLKLESDWESGSVPKKVDNLYTIRKDELRYIVYKISYDNDCRLRIIGRKGKTQTFIGEPINQLYKFLAREFGCNEPEDALKKHIDEMYKRALDRLTKE